MTSSLLMELLPSLRETILLSRGVGLAEDLVWVPGTHSFRKKDPFETSFPQTHSPIPSHSSSRQEDLEGNSPRLITFLVAIPQVPDFCSLFV